MNDVQKLNSLPIRTISISKQSLYAEQSSGSQDDYKPMSPYTSLPLDKKKNSQPSSHNQRYKPSIPIKKPEHIQLPIVNTITPKNFDDFNNESYQEFTVRPLNFKEQPQPKRSAYGHRSHDKSNVQPFSEPRGINFRYREPRQKTGNLQARQQRQQTTIPNNNRVLMSSQGVRWNSKHNSITKRPQPQAGIKNLLSEFMDRTNSKLIQQYDNYQRIFNNWVLQMAELPFRVNISSSKEEIIHAIEQSIFNQVDFKGCTHDIPQAEWDQEKLKAYFLTYRMCSRSLSRQYISKQSVALKKYKNCVYFGGMQNGKKEGDGILIYYSGRRFQGSFVNDLKSKGLETDNSEIYIGEFDNGIREGRGAFKSQGCVAYGKFKDGEWITNGVSVKGDSIFISFQSSSIKLIKGITGELFLGDTIGNEKNGIGIQKFINGDLYIGNYDNDKPEGYGQYFWSNGAVYLGQFLSGLRHGRGKWYILNGDSYQGDYMNDKKCGEGQYRWRNGTYYKGSFENDYRHGYGEMYWSDNKVYKGQWTNGIQNQKRIQFESDLKKGPNTLKKVRTISDGIPKARLPILKSSQYQRYRIIKNNISKSINKTIQVKTATEKTKSNFTTLNSTHRSIPREGLKAIFNPNFNFDY